MRFPDFPTSSEQIQNRINDINPVEYGGTRNYTNGAVTRLSPYISRGVISARMVMEQVLEKGFTLPQSAKFLQELAWREYFQRVWQYMGDDILEDIRQRYTGILHTRMPKGILEAETGIDAVDKGIKDLYCTGYLHNHLRMYIAGITCNIAKAHWQLPAQWMYYHLLDGDLASNNCSWQWVAGTFSSKQYFCNQENINKYTGSVQKSSFLDVSYDELPRIPVPSTLRNTLPLTLHTPLPEKKQPVLDEHLPLLLYTSYNMDPNWRNDIPANRLLVLEPSHFRQFPVSEKVIRFILSLSINIQGLQVFTGEVSEIPGLQKFPVIYSKEHPLFKHFPGQKDERDWLFPEVKDAPGSFSRFWKKCEAMLNKKEWKIASLMRA